MTLMPYPDDPWNSFDLREAGPDGEFDTDDDVIYLTECPEYTGGTSVNLFIQEGSLPSGYYRFRMLSLRLPVCNAGRGS